jgi:hypothetical protein
MILFFVRMYLHDDACFSSSINAVLLFFIPGDKGVCGVTGFIVFSSFKKQASCTKKHWRNNYRK